MIEIFNNREQEAFISSFQNPFDISKLKSIRFSISKYESIFDKKNFKINYISYITFEAGQTTGEHRIEEESFEKLIKSTESFIQSLK